MKNLPQRKPNRLKEYDYSQNGAYFITICTKDRTNLFWDNVGDPCRGDLQSPVLQNDTHMSKYGKIAENEINVINSVYGDIIKVEKFVVMPNHIHMIILIDSGRLQVAPTISRIIQQYKRSISKKIGFSIWQKSFHDHVIRDENEYRKIWEYIDTNPLKWEEDCFYISQNNLSDII